MKSADSDLNRPRSDVQRSYSAYLIVRPPLPEEVVRQVTDLVKEYPAFEVAATATATAIEIEYIGRDSSRFIVRTLARLARLIGNADGEVRCQIDGDADELWFEFYRIRDGRLFRQDAEVVRQPEYEVTEDSA
jgi:hypothetical protein